MASSLRPGCLVRSTLALLGVAFLPLAVWFVYANWRLYWGESLVLFSVGLIFLHFATTREEGSWITMLDDLDGPANPNDTER